MRPFSYDYLPFNVVFYFTHASNKPVFDSSGILASINGKMIRKVNHYKTYDEAREHAESCRRRLERGRHVGSVRINLTISGGTVYHYSNVMVRAGGAIIVWETMDANNARKEDSNEA